ncbi:MAG: hypothetical protein P4L40_14865, partial [Terracidiphilus sp.]|nr:hypothetical protein [Terracidiphilus sp.]
PEATAEKNAVIAPSAPPSVCKGRTRNESLDVGLCEPVPLAVLVTEAVADARGVCDSVWERDTARLSVGVGEGDDQYDGVALALTLTDSDAAADREAETEGGGDTDTVAD